jgi:hypothetical protein
VGSNATNRVGEISPLLSFGDKDEKSMIESIRERAKMQKMQVQTIKDFVNARRGKSPRIIARPSGPGAELRRLKRILTNASKSQTQEWGSGA